MGYDLAFLKVMEQLKPINRSTIMNGVRLWLSFMLPKLPCMSYSLSKNVFFETLELLPMTNRFTKHGMNKVYSSIRWT